MGRFQDEHVQILKAFMLKRLPECKFTDDDWKNIQKETDLEEFQIKQWAKHVRQRYVTDSEREDYLRQEKNDQDEEDVKASRYYVSCFNIDPSSARNLHFGKSKPFKITFIVGAFKIEAKSAEFFINFDGRLRFNQIREGFKQAGAGGIFIHSFEKDGGEGAADSISRLHKIQRKTEFYFEHGECPMDIKRKIYAKGKNDITEKELDDKTSQILKKTIEDMQQHVDHKMQDLGQSVTGIETSVEELESGMEGISSQIGGMSKGISDLSSNIHLHWEQEMQSKDATIVTLRNQLKFKESFIEKLSIDLARSKYSHHLTLEEMNQERQFSRTLLSEINAIHEKVSQIQEFSVIQDRRMQAMSKQNNIRFHMLSQALKIKQPVQEGLGAAVFKGDLLFLVASNFVTPQWLIRLSQVNKTVHAFFKSSLSGPIWNAASRFVCGEEYMAELPSYTPNSGDARYISMLRMCPWLTIPRYIPGENISLIETDNLEPDTYYHISNVHVGKETVTCWIESSKNNENEASEFQVKNTHVQIIPSTEGRYTIRRFSPDDMGMMPDFSGYDEVSDGSPDEFVKKLKENSCFPDELSDIISKWKHGIRYSKLHKGAFALFSHFDPSDVYIFSTDCKRLLKRLYIRRNISGRVTVRCKGPFLYISVDHLLQCFGPSHDKKIRA